MTPLGGFLLALYRSAQDCPFEQFRDRALSRLARFTAFDSARWGSGVLTPAGLAMHDTHLHNEPQELLTAYEEVRSQDHMVITAWPEGGGLASVRVHPATHYAAPECSGIRDYQRRFCHENALAVGQLRGDDQHMNYIGLYRADERAQFRAEEDKVVRRLFPHLLEALRINSLLHARERAPATRNPDSCLGIADTSGAVLHAEPRVSELLAAEWPQGCNGRLPSMLMEALASKGGFRGTYIRVTASLTQGMVFFRVRPLCPADTLSPRELEVALAMAGGATHKAAAARFSLSPETVRTHLRHAYDKLGTRNRAQLVVELARME